MKNIIRFIRELDKHNSSTQVIIRPSRHTANDYIELFIKSDIYYDEYNGVLITLDDDGHLVGCPEMTYTWVIIGDFTLPETTSLVLDLIDKHF